MGSVVVVGKEQVSVGDGGRGGAAWLGGGGDEVVRDGGSTGEVEREGRGSGGAVRGGSGPGMCHGMDSGQHLKSFEANEGMGPTTLQKPDTFLLVC